MEKKSKEIKIIYEPTEGIPEEEMERRLARAYAMIFEEVIKARIRKTKL